MKLIGRFLGVFCLIAWVLTSLVLLFYYWEVLTGWLGGLIGTFVVLVAAPGAFVFPLIYWFVQGAFPVFYFELLGACLITGICGAALWSISE